MTSVVLQNFPLFQNGSFRSKPEALTKTLDEKLNVLSFSKKEFYTKEEKETEMCCDKKECQRISGLYRKYLDRTCQATKKSYQLNKAKRQSYGLKYYHEHKTLKRPAKASRQKS
jgi:hypothetical protein